MKEYTVKQFEPQYRSDWNAFVSQAKNASFLFQRDFMEYHQDRFHDFSLLVFDKKKIVGVLPANRVGTTVYSHQGLTYGGLVLSQNSKLYDVIYIFKALLDYLNKNEIESLQLKLIPSIYCDTFSDEINYLMYVCKAKLIMKHNLSVINLTQDLTISKSRKQCISRGKNQSLWIKEEHDLTAFWNQLLIPNLEQKYQSKPVHSLEEMMNLMQKFPHEIRHFNVYSDQKLVCGTTVFISKNVVKPQYIAGSEENNELGSIDFLYHYLISEVAKDKRYFDLGPSHENSGLEIVKNINFWKESYGAHSLVQDFYEVETKNSKLLEHVLV